MDWGSSIAQGILALELSADNITKSVCQLYACGTGVLARDSVCQLYARGTGVPARDSVC